MKKKKFNELIQKPLRFHHQDIHEELEELKGMIRDVSYQMQELREAIRGAPLPTQMLSVQQPTSIRGGNISGMDLSLVEIISGAKSKRQEQSILTKQDLQFQEQRKQRKVKRLDFEVR